MTTAREAADLFQQYREELGFVNEAQCREKDLYVERRDGDVVGAALVNHCVRKPQTTLYDIAVAKTHRRVGIAELLIETVVQESPHEKIIAKCPVDLDANAFYESTGWNKQNVEDGKNRALNVWKYPIDTNE